MRLVTTLTSLVLALTFVSGASAQRQQLQVGSQAPGLDIEEWVKGNETSIESGKSYVIVFWATWCGPCKRAVPMLTEMQERLGSRGLTIIGISDEDVETVKPFVAQWAGRMEYTIAVDRRGQTKRQWFEAANLPGIPAAFVVDGRGTIQWIGNPLADDFSSVVERVARGRFDSRLMRQTRAVRDNITRQRELRNYRQAISLIDELVNVDARVFAPWMLTKFDILLHDQRDRDAAYAYANEIVELYGNDVELLQDLARKIAGDSKINDADRDLDTALAIAQAAGESLNEDEPERYATTAYVHYRRGELDKAIELQRQAFFVARPDSKRMYESVLRDYQQAARRAARIGS